MICDTRLILFLEKSILFYSIFSPIYERGTFCPLTCNSNPAYGYGALNLFGLKSIPTNHDFRGVFALIMLRNGVESFALQKLMRPSDLPVLRRYLAQTDDDVHTAHMRDTPVDGNL
jgi:integrase